MPRIKIYTTDFCVYCHKAKQILESKNLEFEEVNIHGSDKMRDEIEKLTGRRDVPQVFIDGIHIGDDDELATLSSSGKLDEMFKNERSTDPDGNNKSKRRQWFRRA